MQAKTVIVAEVERLRWRIWNGKAKNARRSIDWIRKVMHVFRGERDHRTTGAPSRKLWHALHEVDSYLKSQSRSKIIISFDKAVAALAELMPNGGKPEHYGSSTPSPCSIVCTG
jgi:esterase/lipase